MHPSNNYLYSKLIFNKYEGIYILNIAHVNNIHIF